MQIKSGMEAFVMNLLQKKLPPNYCYHNPEHTMYVTDKATEIGKAENCTVTELNLLKAAALWHDAGYINTYSHHEEASCLLARKYLPEFGFNIVEIDFICEMIMATRIPQTPHNKLEEILADADLEYLGTEGAILKAAEFYKELNSISPLLTVDQWNLTQISFIKKHRYFTPFCKANREPSKSAYLRKLQLDMHDHGAEGGAFK